MGQKASLQWHQDYNLFLQEIFTHDELLARLLQKIRVKYLEKNDELNADLEEWEKPREYYTVAQKVLFILTIEYLKKQFRETPSNLEGINISVRDLITQVNSS